MPIGRDESCLNADIQMMGFGGIQVGRIVDDTVRHVERAAEAFRQGAGVVDPLILGEVRGARTRAKVLAPAIASTSEAERLLRGLSASEPGLAPMLDAVQGARAVLSMPRVSQLASGHAFGDMRDMGRGLQAWAHVRDLGPEARQAAVERIRTTPVEQLAKDDWLTLAGILGDDVDGALTAGLPTKLGDALPVRRLALNAVFMPGVNPQSRFFTGHRYFGVWNASKLDVEVRGARIDELLSGDPFARTREEWDELQSLLGAGGHDIAEHAWFPGHRLEDGVRLAWSSGYDVARRAPVRLENASASQLESARQSLRGDGPLDPLATSIVQRNLLDRLGIVGEEAAAVRRRHMVPTDPEGARIWMQDMRAALDAAKVDGPARELRETAYELLDRNVARVEGERKWIWRDGYRNHPDYAELGRVTSIHGLLEQIGALRTRPAAQATGSVADGAERLTW